MELLGGICGLGIFLAILTLVGHGFWVVLSLLWRGLTGRVMHDPREREDLRALRRELSRLQSAGLLDDATADRVRTIAESPTALAEFLATSTGSGPELQPAWQRLEMALADRTRRGEPSPAGCEGLLRRYAELPEYHRALLSAGALFQIAGLLTANDRGLEALQLYQQLIRRSPQHSATPRTALVAARLAQQLDRTGDVRELLTIASSSSDATIQREIAELRAAWSLGADIPQVAARESSLGSEVSAVEFESVVAAPVRPPLPRMTATTTEPPRPRRTLSEWLATFMEERNILWGELIGGLLIVGCSIMLVISLWSTLRERIPYFEFFLLVGVNTALFGAGLYTHYRWKLRSTSEGFLLISLVLVPLNFLAMAALSLGTFSGLRIVAEIVSLGLLGVLTAWAGKIVARHGPWLTVAIIGCSAAVLAIPRLVDASTPALPFLGVALLPAVCFLLPATATSWLDRRQVREEPEVAARSMVFQGLALFALCVAWGLLVFRGVDVARGLDRLAPLLAVALLAPLSLGLSIWRGMSQRDDTGHWAMLGSAVALASVVGLVAAVILAWPQSLVLLVVGLVSGAALAVLAWRERLAALHAGAIACLSVAYLVGFHCLASGLPVWPLESGTSRQLLTLAIAPLTGVGLLGWFAALAATAECLRFLQRDEDRRYYQTAAGIVALVSLALVMRDAAQMPLRPALLFGAYSLTLMATALRNRKAIAVGLAQVGLTVSATLTAAHVALGQSWFTGWELAGSDPRWWYFLIIAVATQGALWTVARVALRRWSRWSELVEAPNGDVDRVLRVAVVPAATAVALYGVVPGALQELGLRALAAGKIPLAQSLVFGPEAALALGLIGATLAVAPWDRWRNAEILAALALVVVTAAQVAGRWTDELAVASALRWTLAATYLALAALVWARGFLKAAATRLGMHIEIDDSSPNWSRALLGCGALAPVVLLSGLTAWRGFEGAVLPGPLAGSWFDQPLITSHVVPLAALIGALVGFAVRERSAGYAFGGGLLANATVAGGFALWRVTDGGGFHRNDVVLLPQLSALVAAAWAVAWLASRQRLNAWREAGRPVARGLMLLQIGYPLLLHMILCTFTLGVLLASPDGNLLGQSHVGHPIGWLGLLLTGLALSWELRSAAPALRFDGPAFVAVLLGVLAAAFAMRFDTGQWQAYHTLLAAWTMLGVLLVFASSFVPRSVVERWTLLTGALVVMLAARAADHDPAGPGPAAAAVLSYAVLAGVMAIWFQRGAFVYLSGALVNASAALVWIGRQQTFDLGDFLAMQAGCLAGVSAGWYLLEHVLRIPVPHLRVAGARLDFGREANLIAMAILAMLVIPSLGADALGMSEFAPVSERWMTTALAAVIGALALSLGEPMARHALPSLYGCGLLAVGWSLHRAELQPLRLAQSGGLALAGYAAAVAAVAVAWPWLKRSIPTLRLAATEEADPRWWDAAQTVLATAALGLGVIASLWFESARDRWAAVPTAALVALAGAQMAMPAADGPRRRWQATTLAALAMSGITWLWIGASGSLEERWLERVVALVVVPAIGTLCAWSTPRSSASWSRAAWRFGYQAAPLAAGATALLLALEGRAFLAHDRDVPLNYMWIAAAAAALVLLAGQAVAWAMRRASDPWGVEDRRRTFYVYAAEVIALMLFVHLRLCLDEWFSGLLAQYWTLIVMGVAFLGAGLAEWFTRRGLSVLAEPLANTAVGLPLLPALGYWFFPGAMRYEAVLLLAGAFYTWHAVSRRQWPYGAAAALAFQGALWSLWHNVDINFNEHPQLWLIPPALVVLVAEHLNRARLSARQSEAVRYLALGTLYVSSSADMYIAGIGRSLMLPLVLMVLSVAGVLLGIVLRLRSFVYLGVSFLLLVLVTMIWYAAVDLGKTWIWYASGIGLGILVLALFGWLEKHRQDVSLALEKFRQWT